LSLGDNAKNRPDAVIFHGASQSWPVVTRRNDPDSDKCFDPPYTNIKSKFKPIVHEQPDGTWELTFLS